MPAPASLEPTLACPHCGKDIKLTESLAAPMLEASRKEFQIRLAEQAGATKKAEERAKEAEDAAAKARAAAAETARLAAEKAAEKARQEAHAFAAQELAVMEKKLGEAQQAQAEALRKGRELDDARRELELTVEKRVQASLTSLREEARKDADEAAALRLKESETKMEAMKRTIEELQRKAEQGSQQLQGEVLEVEIEERLKTAFPLDQVEPVPKGEFGGDLLQKVGAKAGDPCGTIIWELKRTKHWTDGWLPKLRGDQRAAKADVAVLIATTLPKGVEVFDCIDGVWVCSPSAYLPLCTAIRATLSDVRAAKRSMEGMRTKAEEVYEYLTGPLFRQRVAAIIEAFSGMKEDLEKERKALQRIWAKREEQIVRVITSTSGMFGELQGIAGRALDEIPGLSLDAIAAPAAEALP